MEEASKLPDPWHLAWSPPSFSEDDSITTSDVSENKSLTRSEDETSSAWEDITSDDD